MMPCRLTSKKRSRSSNTDVSSPIVKRGASIKRDGASLKAIKPLGYPPSAPQTSPTRTSPSLGDIKGLANQALFDLTMTFDFKLPIQMLDSTSSLTFEFSIFEDPIGDSEVNADVEAAFSLDLTSKKLPCKEKDSALGEKEYDTQGGDEGATNGVQEAYVTQGGKVDNSACGEHKEEEADAPQGGVESVGNQGGEGDDKSPLIYESDEEAKARSSSPHSLLTTISRGQTPSCDMGASSERVSIPSHFPSSFRNDIGSSLLKGGIPLNGLVSENINLGDTDLAYNSSAHQAQDFVRTPEVGAGLATVSLGIFFLGVCRGPKVGEEREVRSGASSSSTTDQNEAINNMAN